MALIFKTCNPATQLFNVLKTQRYFETCSVRHLVFNIFIYSRLAIGSGSADIRWTNPVSLGGLIPRRPMTTLHFEGHDATSSVTVPSSREFVAATIGAPSCPKCEVGHIRDSLRMNCNTNKGEENSNV
jgi:hypothetical protein